MANKHRSKSKPPPGSYLAMEYEVEQLCSYYFCHSEGDLGIKSNMGACITALQMGYTYHGQAQYRDFSKVVAKRDAFQDVWKRLFPAHQDTLFALYGWIKRFPPTMVLFFPHCHQLAYLAPSSPPGYTQGAKPRPVSKDAPSRPFQPPVLNLEELAEKPKKSEADKQLITTINQECLQMKREAVQAFYHIWVQQCSK